MRSTVMVLALLGACATPERPGAPRVSAADSASCRQQADATYTAQNRAEVYRADTYATAIRDAPFASSGLPGITSNGLSGRYARDTLLAQCLRRNAVGGQPAPTVAQPGPN